VVAMDSVVTEHQVKRQKEKKKKKKKKKARKTVY
jgi:hypothetical protein